MAAICFKPALLWFTCSLMFLSASGREQNPVGAVFDLEADTHGFLWLATENGLIRFDGHHYQLVRRVSERGFPIQQFDRAANGDI